MPTEYEPWQARKYPEWRDSIDMQFLIDVTVKTTNYAEFGNVLMRAARKREDAIEQLNNKLRG